TVSGSVDPKGLPTTYHYEYGTTPNFGQSTSNANAGSGTTPADTNAGLGSLPTNTRIYYRLVSDNADGQSIGSTNSFQTQPAPQGGPTPGVNVYAHTGFVSPHTPIVGIFVANLQNTKESSTLSIAHGNTTIASRHFTLAPGAAGFVHITLTKTGLHDLHVYQGRHQLLSVQAHIAGTKINHYLGLAEWGYSGVK
ncbi:MAG: hypothetical protein J2O48_00880, partial [Solirubrobacterales bacterium]|nr:hypothetical protein [Solirubrobacterales bacterium]